MALAKPMDSERSPSSQLATAIAALRSPTELLALGVLSLGYALIYSIGISPLYAAANLLGPLILTATLVWGSYVLVRRSSLTLWTPLFWFRMVCAAYFGIGAIVPHIGNPTTRAFVFGLYRFDAQTNLKVNLLYAAGIFLVLLLSSQLLRLSHKSSDRPSDYTSTGSDQTAFFAIVFILFGSIIRYFFVIPYNFGLTEFVLPGSITTLSNTFYVGVYLLVYLAVRRGGSYAFAAASIILFDVAVSIASFSKSELFIIIIFAFLGYLSSGVNIRKAMIGVISVIFIYSAFQPLVTYGRESLARKYGEIRGADLHERWGIVESYFRLDRSSIPESLALARLSYMSVNAFVVDRYDSGIPGKTLADAPAVVIPRVLWPDKPIITRLGQELNYLVRGRRGSAMGAGHFAEAYWNFGWWGYVPCMAVLSIIFAVFSSISAAIMARKDWLLLPVVFLGVNLGIRVDGHFVPDMLGAAWMAIVLGACLSFARPLVGTLISAFETAGRERNSHTIASRRGRNSR